MDSERYSQRSQASQGSPDAAPVEMERVFWIVDEQEGLADPPITIDLKQLHESLILRDVVEVEVDHPSPDPDVEE